MMIQVSGLTKNYGMTPAVRQLTFAVAAGELLVLVGGSGSGKTTTLKMINRLIEPTAGTVQIDGQDAGKLPGHLLRRRIGYVFQRIGLFPHLTVAGNIAVPLTLAGVDRTRTASRVAELLELVELPDDVARRYPSALSGGQQQRVGVARALAAEPRIMLLDEPFGALDPMTRDRLQQTFLAIRQRLRLTAVFVTHDMVEALLLADRIAVLDHGRLVQVGTPAELWAKPADECVAELLETPRRQAASLEKLLGANPARPS